MVAGPLVDQNVTRFREQSVADAPKIPDEAETRARWGDVAWTAENAAKAKEIIGRYPPGRAQ